ncbi:MAG: chemotaxis protein CheW [Acidobacteriota bacterium]
MSTTSKPVHASSHAPWVVVQVWHHHAALHSSIVRELVIQPDVTPVPRMPDYIRGVMNWRGKIIPNIDLRLRLGMPSARGELNELAGLITAHAADHMAWIEELENSLSGRRPFTLTTDPHACAFGRWYDNYRTGNLTIDALLRKMDAPHKAVHAIAVQVEALKEQGRFEEAKRLVDSTRETTLSRLLDLFTGFEQAIEENHSPVAIILNTSGALAALTVDRVEAVEAIDPSTIEPLADSGVESRSSLIRFIARRGKDAGLVGLIDESQILESAAGLHELEAA